MLAWIAWLLLRFLGGGLGPSPAPAPERGAPPVPEPPPWRDALLVREFFAVRGADRTANWVGRIDARGCWWEAHNTWLRVEDPAIRRWRSRGLHFNGAETGPWFCLPGDERAELKRAAAAAGLAGAPLGGASFAERWTVPGRGAALFPAGQPPPGLEPLVRALERIARRGPWGLSPEGDAGRRRR